MSLTLIRSYLYSLHDDRLRHRPQLPLQVCAWLRRCVMQHALASCVSTVRLHSSTSCHIVSTALRRETRVALRAANACSGSERTSDDTTHRTPSTRPKACPMTTTQHTLSSMNTSMKISLERHLSLLLHHHYHHRCCYHAYGVGLLNNDNKR